MCHVAKFRIVFCHFWPAARVNFTWGNCQRRVRRLPFPRAAFEFPSGRVSKRRTSRNEFCQYFSDVLPRPNDRSLQKKKKILHPTLFHFSFFISHSFIFFVPLHANRPQNMILSMTGYGKASAEFQGKKITAEVKSLNSKALDLSTRVAPIYREKEMEVRAMVTQALERGKVELNLWIEQQNGAEACPINGELVAAYHRQMQEISAKYGIPEPDDYWRAIIRMPDVLLKTDVLQELSEEEWLVARNVVQQAIDQLVAFRRQEGEALQKKFEEKLDNIAALLASIEPFEKQRVEKIRQRIVEGLAAIPDVQYDKNRLEQEMIYYIEKLDINEEKQRLANHLEYFRVTMEEGHGQGKKLGFIAQEMGREINTTGSKSNLAEMQNIVVKMKDELEQIKEQVLNVM